MGQTVYTKYVKIYVIIQFGPKTGLIYGIMKNWKIWVVVYNYVFYEHGLNYSTYSKHECLKSFLLEIKCKMNYTTMCDTI